ncbi:Transport protein particle subunit trs31 [Penicillium oxalicum]|uniref:Transport protein particle subunit trs31 n=1 Tax=Penicillium oxalicum TaxID=69781 RepID=UPI0020B87545|nr:Transport protein particle subunit trs31 [Penicillium oxalicum]KAI2789896.1 Transport protein particle subunit trs31 [Penicillium oxalicum]
MAAPPRHSAMLSMNNAVATPQPMSSDKSQNLQQSSTPQPSQGLRVPSNRKTIYDRHLNRSRNAELSRASFAYLFAEMVTYAQRRVTGIQDLEKRLNEQGYPLGLRLLDLLFYRTTTTSSSALSSSSTSSSPPNRPLRILTLLHLIHGPLWRLLFGRSADALEHSVSPDTPNEYMITDNDPLVNTYISVPREMNQLNCAAFVAVLLKASVTAMRSMPENQACLALHGETLANTGLVRRDESPFTDVTTFVCLTAIRKVRLT